ncbi:MAG: DNA mismatch repair endonuclease MutL [Oscillospiraceae bacterium]|nr:DNA mismatch repair endonuclease MutL [Oscillospiraceae bacterium]
MSEIRVLDKQIAELIAAGEVIDRPASVVKELIENCIDAGALHITVEIKSGGIELIRVTDDGKGIAFEDAETAFLRHATSKVRSKDDLNEILTLGFRGEALASVCAVSKVSMITRQASSDFGCHLEIAGGEVISKEETGCPVGTTIIVKNLFYNTPARMKFLKKDVSEANAVAAVVEKIAVSNPQIAFKFIRDGRIDIQTVGDGKLISAIHCVFGKAFASSLLPVSFEKNGVKVEGFISKALSSKAKRSMQYFFLNGRTVKNVTMMVALEESYKGSIMVGKFPACVLMVEVAPSVVDVNVHPTKTEVRFSDERVIYDAVYFACKNALNEDSGEADFVFKSEAPKTPASLVKDEAFTTKGEQIVFEKPQQTENPALKPQIQNEFKPIFEKTQEEIIYTPPKALMSVQLNDDSVKYVNAEKVPLSSKVKNPLFEEKVEPAVEVETVEIPQNEFAPAIEEKAVVPETVPAQDDRFAGAKIIGELFKTYILLEAENALYLVDKHAAHERLIYNRLKAENTEVQRQYLLEPVITKPSREEYDALTMHIDVVNKLGFEIDDFGSGNIIIRSVPAYISAEDTAPVLSEIASNLISCKKEVAPQVLDDMYHTIACRSAIKAHDKSSAWELSFLIDCLKAETDVKYCPHGRPVTAKVSKTEIEKRFGRIQ